MVFLWGLWAVGGIAVAWHERRTRSWLFWSAALLTPFLIAAFVLAGIDNMQSNLVDCRDVVDPSTGADVLSCRTEHWLPPSMWRVINRF